MEGQRRWTSAVARQLKSGAVSTDSSMAETTAAPSSAVAAMSNGDRRPANARGHHLVNHLSPTTPPPPTEGLNGLLSSGFTGV